MAWVGLAKLHYNTKAKTITSTTTETCGIDVAELAISSIALLF